MSIFAAVVLAVVAVAMARAGFPADVHEALQTSKDLYVATERKDGSLSKVSPIWFMYDGEAVYTTTVPTSYKAKRIKLGRPLHVWVGSADGPSFVARAELLADPAVAERMAPVYNKKYWIAWAGLFRPRPERVRAGQTLIIRIPAPS